MLEPILDSFVTYQMVHKSSVTIPCFLLQVCITLYWLGKCANKKEYYKGPQLNLDVFTNLIFDGSASLKVRDFVDIDTVFDLMPSG